MNNLAQNALHLTIGILVAAIIWYFQPQQTLTPQGILLPTHPLLAPTSPDQVKLYDHLPAGATVLGNIRTTKHFDSLDDTAQKKDFAQSIKYAQTLAAAGGANGLWIQAAGHSEGDVNPLDGFLVYAAAIRIS